MADLTPIINKLAASLPQSDTIASEGTSLGTQGFVDKSSQYLNLIHENIATLTATTQLMANVANANANAANRQIVGIGKQVSATGKQVTGSRSAFNLSSVQIDPTTGSGIATALAFSAFPGLAKLYVRGVRELTEAFGAIPEKQLEKLKQNAGSFEAMTQVIGTIQALNFKDLLGSSIVLRLTAKSLGKNVGAMFVDLMEGIRAGSQGLLDVQVDSDGRVTGDSPLARLSSGFVNIMSGLQTLIDISSLQLLKQTFLFRLSAGFIGKNLGEGVKKLYDELPQAEIVSLSDTLKTLNDGLENLEIFDKIPMMSVIKGVEMLKAVSETLKGVSIRAIEKLPSIIAPFNDPTLNNGLENLEIFDKIPMMSIIKGVEMLKAVSETLKGISIRAIEKLPSIIAPFNHRNIFKGFENIKKITDLKIKFSVILYAVRSLDLIAKILGPIKVKSFEKLSSILFPFHDEKEVMLGGFNTLKELSNISKATKWAALNLGMLGLAGVGVGAKLAGKAFRGIGQTWKSIHAGVRNLNELKRPLIRLMRFPVKPLLAFMGKLTLVFGAAALSIAMIGKAFQQMPNFGKIMGGIAALGAVTAALAGIGVLIGAGGFAPVLAAAGAFAIVGLSLIPLAKGFEMLSKVKFGDFDVKKFLAIGGSLALIGIPLLAAAPGLIYGSIGLLAIGAALPIFSKGLSALMGVDLSDFNILKFLAIGGSLALIGIPLGLAAPGLMLGGLGLMVFGKGLHSLMGLDIKQLPYLGIALYTLLNSLDGLMLKSLGMFFLGRAFRSLGNALSDMTESLDAGTLTAVSKVFESFSKITGLFGSVVSAVVTKLPFGGLSSQFKSLGKALRSMTKDLNVGALNAIINLFDKVNDMAMKMGDQAGLVAMAVGFKIMGDGLENIGNKISKMDLEKIRSATSLMKSLNETASNSLLPSQPSAVGAKLGAAGPAPGAGGGVTNIINAPTNAPSTQTVSNTSNMAIAGGPTQLAASEMAGGVGYNGPFTMPG